MASRGMSWRHLLEVVGYRAAAELRAEVKRTYAGFLWWIVQPVLTFGVYFVAFKWVLPDRENFAVFLFTGITLWQWFHLSAMRSSQAIVGAGGLVQRVNLHKIVFPVSAILVNTVKFGVTLLVLVGVLIASGVPPTPAWLGLVPVLVVQLVVVAGVGCLLAGVTPFVPDVHLVFSTFLHLLFFVSGVLYDLGELPWPVADLLYLNPIAVLIDLSRGVLLEGEWPAPERLVLPLVEGIVLCAVAWGIIHRFDKVYPKYG